MRLLLDTHTFIWLDNAPTRLSQQVRNAIEEFDNILLLSMVSVWEIQIKVQLGRLDIPNGVANLIQRQRESNGIELLPITIPHVLALSELPFHHGDPFDRLLISQARVEDLIMVTKDDNISKYPVDLLW